MVSIIIPVYNTFVYIDRCLQSVVRQDYDDWECIVVDDGSKDDSLLLCEKWNNFDKRIRIISQENGGVSSARNVGLKIAKGKYVCFVDSDDWVECGYVSDMLDSMRYAEIAVSGITKHLIDSGKVEESSVPYRGCFDLDKNHAFEFACLNENSLLYGPVNKMYSMDIIREHDLKFPCDYSYGEDLVFNFSYLRYVKRIAMVNKNNYNYEIHEESLSQKYRPSAFVNDYSLWKIRESFMMEKVLWVDETKKVMYKFLWGQIYSALFTSFNDNYVDYVHVKNVLSVPEIEKIAEYKQLFSCSKWIVFLILHRMAFVLYCILNLRRWIFHT